MTRTEGDGASRLLQLLRGDKRLPTTITNATVTQINPLALRIVGYRDDIPAEALVVAESLTDHERTWRLKNSGEWQTYEIESPLKVGDTVIIALVDDGQLIYVFDREAS